MDYSNLNNKLKELKIEEYIWIIYIGIIILSFYSNELERKYFIYNSEESKKKYHDTIIIIFTILVIIYFYFFYNSFDELKKNNYDNKKNKLLYLSFIASLLILISGLIYLYIAIKDENIDVELSFN